MDKRFLGSTLKSKSPGTDDGVRFKRNSLLFDEFTNENNDDNDELTRHERSASYEDEVDDEDKDWLHDSENIQETGINSLMEGTPIKRFLRKYLNN